MARRNRGTVNPNPTSPASPASPIPGLSRRAALQTLGVGVAAAAIAVVLYVRTPVETRGVEPAVAPVSGGAVVGVGGRF